jgi:single-stranded-DNA-specific exonuclease
VAFNLVIAVRSALRDEGLLEKEQIPNLRRYLDIVALGTLADVVPLVDENRIIVTYGLEEIGNGLRPGIRALKEVSALDGYLKSWSVVFQLVPRLNAAGRLGDSSLAFKLLTAESYDDARSVAETLDRMNVERRTMVEKTLQEALEEIKKTANFKNGNVIVLSSSKWHPGIIGIVASRLVDMFYKPTVLIAVKDGIGRGSARSVDGVSVLGLLRECEVFFDAYGGHNQAAGFTIKEDELKAFSEAMNEVAAREINKTDLVQEMLLDGMINLHDLSEEVVIEIERLAPFGPANPEPLLGLVETNIVQSRIVGDNHLKMTLKQKDSFGDAIGFNLAESFPNLLSRTRQDTNSNNSGDQLSRNKFEVAFTPFLDKWKGKSNVKLKIKDIKNI